MAQPTGWPFAARDQAWIDVFLVVEDNDRALEEALRKAVPNRALRPHHGERRDLDTLKLPPMPVFLYLDWRAEDEFLLGRLRSRFRQAPIVAVGAEAPKHAPRFSMAGTNHCLTLEDLKSPLGAQLVNSVFDRYEKDQAAVQWRQQATHAEERFTSLIEKHIDGILIVDFAGSVRYANPVAHDMFGLDPGRLLGTSFGMPLATSVAELDLVRRDGQPIIVEMRVTDTVWDSTPMRLSALRDVTQRKRDEEELKDSERTIRVILDTMVDGLVIFNEFGQIELFNKAAEEMFGYSADSVIGSDVRELFPDRYADELDAHIAGDLRSGENRLIGNRRELVGRRRDQSTFPIELGLSEVLRQHWSGRGRAERILIGLIRDITHRRQVEASLLSAKSQAELANRVKAEFLANMSHELRTPLNAIIGFAEMIRDLSLGPEAVRRYSDYGGDIYDSGKHLLSLINDVLDMSKIEAGRYQLSESRVLLEQVIDACITMVELRAAQGNIDILKSLPAELPELWVDERAVKQVVLNLLANAVKFTPSGGQVRIAARRENDGSLLLTISDTGIGIPREQLVTVLAPFEQSEAGGGRRVEGTGLGLAISKTFMELHGGALTVDSEVGKGTVVSVLFPAERVHG
jgi:PAS domain S-box-containing protein